MLTFLHPDWFWLLAAVPVLALAKWRADVRGERAVGQVVAARLRPLLVRGQSPARSWTIFGLQLAALAFLAATLARPRLGEEKRELKETGRNIIIALDTSRSMLATDSMNPGDPKPDRLTRAKLAAQDLLALLPGDRVGLIAFAGQAYLQAPLTSDHDAVVETIQAVDHTSVPRGGTDLRKALQVALETFEKSPARNHGLIIFSDGGEPDPELVAMARRAAEKRVLILAVGVGSDAGSDIPDPDSGQITSYFRGNGDPAASAAQDNRARVRDENGNVVITKLESAVLQQLASATGGSFFKLGSKPLTRGVVESLLSSLDQQQASAREETKPIERFQWPLTVAIILLMIAWLIRTKRGGAPVAPAAAAALFVLAAPAPCAAGILASSSSDSVSEAPRAYEQGLFEQARDLYARLKGEKREAAKRHELAYGLGASSLKLKDYDRAVSAFSEALESADTEVQHRSHRGLGHALYDQGDKTLAKQPQFTLKAWADAIRHFEAALKIESDDKEVRGNLEFVKSRIKELKAQIEQQKQQQQQKGGKKDGKKEDGTEEEGAGKDGREPSDKGKQGEQGQEGEQGKEGQQGQQGDQRDQRGKQGEQGQEGEEGKERDGGKDDDQQGKGTRKDDVPEGRIQAGQEGSGGDPVQMLREQENAERNAETGFSRNEARDYLRMFSDDQKQVQFRQSRREPARGKDW